MSKDLPASKYNCPEALHHGPADGAGRCPWCGFKFTHAVSAPERFDVSELTSAYNLYYDPEDGALTTQQIEDQYRMGQR